MTELCGTCGESAHQGNRCVDILRSALKEARGQVKVLEDRLTLAKFHVEREVPVLLAKPKLDRSAKMKAYWAAKKGLTKEV